FSRTERDGARRSGGGRLLQCPSVRCVVDGSRVPDTDRETEATNWCVGGWPQAVDVVRRNVDQVARHNVALFPRDRHDTLPGHDEVKLVGGMRVRVHLPAYRDLEL